MNASILAAQEVSFDYDRHTHSIREVCNEFRVEVFPSIVLIDLWVKVGLDPEEKKEGQIMVIDPEGKAVLTTDRFELANVRTAPLRPGIDFSLNIRFLVQTEGEYAIRLHTGREIVSTHYIYIRS